MSRSEHGKATTLPDATAPDASTGDDRGPDEPSGGRKMLFLGLLLVLPLIALELGGRLLLAVASGGYLDSSARALERQDTARDPADAAPLAPDPSSVQRASVDDPPALADRDTIVHPFFGFVRDPAAPRQYWTVGDDGFFRNDTSPVSTATAEPFRVVILGGSFANHLAFAAQTPLKGYIGGLAGRPADQVEIRSLAMGGYKQPQQLHILADKLVNGEHFDLVINVDGFNEAVLPFDNRAKGVAPTYPINWSQLVGGLPDIDTQLAAGEVAFLRRERRRRAGLCDGWRALSVICHLLWRARDRPLAERLATLDRTLAATATGDSAGGRRFEAYGPVPEAIEHEAQLEQAVALWRRSSVALAALARQHDLPYVHVLQPNQYLPGAKPLGTQERAIAFAPKASHRPYVEDAYPMMQAAADSLRAERVRFIDMSMAFADTEEPVFADRCCHLSRRGYFLFGSMLGQRLIDSLGRLRPPAPASPER